MIDFLKYRYLYFAISGVLVVISLFSLVRYGLRPAVDFTGGVVLEIVVSQEVSAEQIESVLTSSGIDYSGVRPSGRRQFMIKAPLWGEEDKEKVLSSLADSFGEVKELRFEAVGPTAGEELVSKTIAAVGLITFLILLYLAWQLKSWLYGVCAVAGMLHDSLILLGLFSLLGHFWGVEVDTLFVTAVLTTLSFSVHDTVVIFNSVREARLRGLPFEEAVNTALTRTVIRSLNNSWTIIFMLLSLVLLGGETIRWFVVALLAGTVLGTYSSTFFASPFLILVNKVSFIRKK